MPEWMPNWDWRIIGAIALLAAIAATPIILAIRGIIRINTGQGK